MKTCLPSLGASDAVVVRRVVIVSVRAVAVKMLALASRAASAKMKVMAGRDGMVDIWAFQLRLLKRRLLLILLRLLRRRRVCRLMGTFWLLLFLRRVRSGRDRRFFSLLAALFARLYGGCLWLRDFLPFLCGYQGDDWPVKLLDFGGNGRWQCFHDGMNILLLVGIMHEHLVRVHYGLWLGGRFEDRSLSFARNRLQIRELDGRAKQWVAPCDA